MPVVDFLMAIETTADYERMNFSKYMMEDE